MSRLLRGIIAAAVVVLIIAGIWQWREYGTKQDLRDDALLYFDEEDYSKTIQYLESALDRHSLFAGRLNHDMTCYLAESYYQLEDYEEAEAIYDKLIASDSKEPRYYQLKGRCARDAGDYKRAMDIYSQGWEATEDSMFLKDICDIYLEQGDYENALSFTEQGIAAGEDNKGDFMYQKVIIYERSQDYEAAYEAVQEYCELFPNDEDAQKERTFLSTRI